MSTKDLTPIARAILEMAKSRPDLCKPDGEPSTAAISRATQRQVYKVSQPTVSRILRGEITDPSTSAIRALAELFRVTEQAVRGDVYFGKATSPAADALAQRFSQLPDEAQKYILTQVESILELQNNSPRVASKAFARKK